MSEVAGNHDSITVDGLEIPLEIHVGAFVGMPERISAQSVFDQIAKKHI